MGILTKLFGNSGKIRFKGKTDNGKKFSGNMEIETIGYSKEEIEEKLKNILYVEKGWHVQQIKITAFC